MIGGILGRATGKRFDVLAATLLFDPLGVSDVAWTWLPNGDPKNWCCLWMRPRDMAKIGQLVLDRGRWNGGQVVSETWINAATAPQIKTIYRGLDYGFQFWLGASFVSGKRIDWVEAQGQGGQRIFIVPTLDLVTVVTAGNYYGNDRLANLVPQIVFVITCCPLSMRRASYCGATGSGCFASTLPTQADQQTAGIGAIASLEMLPRKSARRRCPSPIRIHGGGYCGNVDQAKSGVVGLT